MSVPLTINTFKTVFGTSQPPESVVPNPVLQVLMVKRIAAQPGAPERYRIVLSDSINFIQAMLATQSNHLVNSGDITKGCIVQLNTYQANLIKDKKILIVIDLKVLKEHPVQKTIGVPVTMDDEIGGAVPPPAEVPQSVLQHANVGSFYGAQPPQAPVRVPGGMGGRTTAQSNIKTETRANIYPIEAISPYQQKWTIKARVINKSDIKTWHSEKSGEGKLFNVTLLDDTGEIRATAFNQECEKFFDILQEGQVYYVSQCRVNMAKKQYSSVNNDYELMFQRDTEIDPCEDDSVPQIKLNIVKLTDLDQIEKNAIVDVLGVVKEVGEVASITSSASGKQFEKRELILVDSSNASVRCTVWGKQAQSWETPEDTVVAFKGVKVSDFGGRSLSMMFSSSTQINPDLSEAHELKGWYDAQGRRELSSYTNHSGLASTGAATGRNNPIKTIDQIREELPTGEEQIYFSLKATVVFIKSENVSYPACLSDGCNKKVNRTDDGMGWICMKCGITHPKAQYRYIMNISVNDAFGQLWLSCFDDVGKMIMGRSADELQELYERSEPDAMDDESWREAKTAYDATFKDAFCKTYIFKCRAKEDTYQEQTRTRYQVLSASPLNFVAEANKLAEQIRLYQL